jgi:hypothetical protein
MSNTARFALPLIAPGQAQKEVYHNEALAVIDAALHASIEEASLDEPPAEPGEGESWLIGAGATGDWAGHDDSLATWTGGGWRFIDPQPGMMVWNKAAGCWLHWSDTVWLAGWPVAALLIDGVQVVGARQPEIASPSGGTTIDAEARATIDNLIVTLKTHGLID